MVLPLSLLVEAKEAEEMDIKLMGAKMVLPLLEAVEVREEAEVAHPLQN